MDILNTEHIPKDGWNGFMLFVFSMLKFALSKHYKDLLCFK